MLLMDLHALSKAGCVRNRAQIYERWADILFDIGVTHFLITLMPMVLELRDRHKPIGMIRSPWPQGLFDKYYRRGIPKNGLARQSVNYNLDFSWDPEESRVILRDQELSLAKEYGIHSGFILPHTIGNSSCVLVCAESTRDGIMLRTTKPHKAYLKTALAITHANIIQNHYEYYNPYTFHLEPIEKLIYQHKRNGMSNNEAAKRLGTSVHNIKYHISKVSARFKTLNNDTCVTKPENLIPLFIKSGLI